MVAFCFALRDRVARLHAAFAGLQRGVAGVAMVLRRCRRPALVLTKGQVLVAAPRHRLAAVSCAVALVAMSVFRAAGVSALLHRLSGIL